MKVFIGINMLMGRKKLTSLKDYIGLHKKSKFRDAFNSRIISRGRFYWLLSNLHFADNTVQPKKGEPDYDFIKLDHF
nr:unnamed protein product [Callosobruchus chinensis]